MSQRKPPPVPPWAHAVIVDMSFRYSAAKVGNLAGVPHPSAATIFHLAELPREDSLMSQLPAPPRTHALISSAGVALAAPVVVLPLAERRAEIQKLLTFVNQHQPITVAAPAAVRSVDEFLTRLRQGWRFTSLSFAEMPPWAEVAMAALASAPVYSVRRCGQCRRWMFVRDPRRKYCTMPACVGERSRERMRRKRRQKPVTASRLKRPR